MLYVLTVVWPLVSLRQLFDCRSCPLRDCTGSSGRVHDNTTMADFFVRASMMADVVVDVMRRF